MTTRNAAHIVAIGLIVSILTQIFYMATLGGPQPSDAAAGVVHADVVSYFTDRWSEIAAVWMVELAAFTAITGAAWILLARGAAYSVAWAALALSGLFNVLQVGIGLSMFRPISTAEETFEPVAMTIVAGAFFFYFLAKVMIGLAGAVIGLGLVRASGAAAKAVGGLAILVGLIAAVANFAALPQGLGLILPAGASGTAAALFTALAILVFARRESSDA